MRYAHEMVRMISARLPAGVALAALVLLAACKHQPEKARPAEPSSPPVAQRPQAPGGAADGLPLPENDGKGGYRTVNSDIGVVEAVWHLRSALNVAALSCGGVGSSQLIASYNTLLVKRKTVLAAAYASEARHYNPGGGKVGQEALDRHMTQVYNFFAQPPVQPAFCATAKGIAAELNSIAPADFQMFSVKAVEQLDAPFVAFYHAYADYQEKLADWKAGRHAPAALASVAASAKAVQAAPSTPWRIQLGAFSGDSAAREAWTKLRDRMPRLGAYKPHYEDVPGKALVRLQLGPVDDRAGAIALCAAAAGAGLDCIPVAVR